MAKTQSAALAIQADGVVNVPVTKATRDSLLHLKDSMNVTSQAEVMAKLVKIGLALEASAK
jgi:hypothetical protein